jgi:hypothetical protein
VPGAELDGVRDAIAAALGGHEARFSHFPMHGLCATCAARRRGGDGPHGPHSRKS